jgi:phosphosulfolactate phosphohydrolase-like enzyme
VSQDSYQVRFDWGHSGAAAVGQDADALVWVSQLLETPGPAHAVAGSLERAGELGAWALAQQEAHGGRFRIAVVAAGAARADGSLRFAVEDLLAAGAIIDAIADVGIDHQSPEAAAAASASRGLSRATRHLISASETARELRSQ